MDVRMPDGYVVRGIPDGTPKAEIMARYQKFRAAPNAEARAGRIASVKAADPSEYDPASPEYRAKYGATSGNSFFDNALLGYGKSFIDTLQGAKQIGAEALDSVTGGNRGATLRAQQTERQRLDAELMGTGGGVAGNVAGVIAQTVAPAGMAAKGAQAAGFARTAQVAGAIANPQTYGAAIGSGAALGALQPVGTDDSRTFNAISGGAAGGAGLALNRIIGRIARPVSDSLSPAQRRAVDTLKKADVPLDTAQRSGSTAAARVKAGFEGNPYTAGAQIDAAGRQLKGFTKAVLRTIGVSADDAGEQTLGAARDRIGSVFNDVSSRYQIDVNPIIGKLADIQDEASRVLTDGRITKQVDNIVKKAAENGGKLDGRAYQAIKGELDTLASQRDVTTYARALRNLLDDGLQQAAKGSGDFERLQTARAQYGRLIKIADATDESGVVSPAKLWQQFNTKANRTQAKFGKGDRELINLARAGKTVLTDKLPNSGTAQRIAAQLAVPAIAGAAGQMLTGDPTEALKYAGLAYAVPRGAQFLMNNQMAAKYMTEGAPMAIQNALASPAANALARWGAISPLIANPEQQ